eukprot:jgi/Ulvmu1/7968/UM004_0201.1
MLTVVHQACRRQSAFTRPAHPLAYQSQGRTAVMAAAKSVLVPIANGSEEMEAVIVIDCLRRAGAEVDVASVESTCEITASRAVKLVADKLITECQGPYDCIALPGGMPGSERLRDSAHLSAMLRQQRDDGRLYAAICAAPAVVLEPQGLLDGPATSHPGFSDKLSNQSQVDERVVVDGNCITSRGPGTAFEFALALVEKLYGAEQRDAVAGPMVMYKY